MITVTYNKADCELTIKGHAGAGEYGHDLVCAAMSALWYTIRKAAQSRVDSAIYEAPGDSEARLKPTHEAHIIMDTVVNGIECIAEEFPENIKLIRTGG